MNILCLFGFHKWKSFVNALVLAVTGRWMEHRICDRCGREQKRLKGGMWIDVR